MILFFPLIYDSETLYLKILISPFYNSFWEYNFIQDEWEDLCVLFSYIDLFHIFYLLGNEAQLDYCSAYVI